jgi:hypothetical protein
LTHIVTLSVDQAKKLHGDPNVVFIDLRDPRELEREGLIPGSFHAPRGMLEFWIDPDSPYHKAIFAERRKFVFYAPAVGGRLSPTRPPSRWGSPMSPISTAASGPGKRPERPLPIRR